MPALGLDRELDELLAQSRAESRYLDLCMVLRRPLVRIRGSPGRRLPEDLELRWGDVVVRPCAAATLPASGELLVSVSSSPEAVGASSRIPSGAELQGPDDLEVRFEPAELLRAGRVWDRLDRCWAPHRSVQQPLVIDLEESQVDFVQWFATWLCAFRLRLPREDTAALVYGGRRGGKTFACLLCLIATVLDVPDTLGWALSVSHVERDVDIDRNIKRLIPAEWYAYREWPAHMYTFPNGSTLKNVSAQDQEAAKRGQVDLVFINEGAKMGAAIYENSLGGTADRGGLVLVASNPPMTMKGEWVEIEVTTAAEAVARGEQPDARVFRIDWKKNRAIDQGARGRIGRILRRLNPALADADDEGLMRPVGDRALYSFDKLKHALRPLPDIGEITEAFTRQKRGRPASYLLVLDFQRRPYIAGTAWKLFGTLDRPELWGVGALCVEGAEDDFLDELDQNYPWHAQNTLVIADATGVSQNYAHENGKTSWGPFFARGWDVVGPQEKKTDKGKGPANPRVELSLGQANRMLTEGRVHVVVDLPVVVVLRDGRLAAQEGLAEALKRCKAGRGKYGLKAVGDDAHLVDTVRYACWWVDPPRQPVSTGVRLNRPAARR